MKQTMMALAALAGLALVACGDENAESTSTSSGNTGGGTTSTGGMGGTGGADGGMGGTGGMATGGMGGMGGDDGCLDASEHEGVFTLDVPELCLVASYDAPFPASSYSGPTWGRHGGPLTLSQAFAGPNPTDELTLRRWAVPAETTGTLTTMEVIGPFNAGVGGSPFFAGQAIDMPVGTDTIVGYADNTLAGEVIALNGDMVSDRWDTAGFFDAAALAIGNDQRLLLSGLSGFGTQTPGASGVYAQDFPGGGGPSGVTVDTWGLANGPIAADTDGNVFAVMTDFGTGMQSLRGWSSMTIAPNAPAAMGDAMWTVEGFGSSLAVVAPVPSEDGLVFFQPQTFTTEVINGDILLQRFGVAGPSITPVGMATAAIDFVEDNTEAFLLTDDQGQVWLGVGDGMGGSLIFVLGRPQT